MTESDFYSDEFEQLIREKTEQYKMYPSEKVWKGIHGSLHTKRRWFIISMSSLVVGILLYAGRELLLPSAHPEIAKRSSVTPSSISGSAITGSDENESSAAASTGRHHNTAAGEEEEQGKHTQSYKWVTVSLSDTETSEPDISDLLSRAVLLPDQAPALPITAAKATGANSAAGSDISAVTTASIAQNMPATNQPATAGNNTNTANSSSLTGAAIQGTEQANGANSFAANKEEVEVRIARNESAMKNVLAATKQDREDVSGDQTIADPAGKAAQNAIPFSDAIADQQKSNWLQEYAFYNLSLTPRRGRKFLQLYLTPMISYRSLSGGSFATKSTTLNVPVAFHMGDAKDFVDHNPALGFEMGGLFQYRLTRNLTIKGGLQFNFSRYTIRAYTSNPQQATIALNSYYGYYLDSVTAITSIRNFGGKTQVNLNNDYYQLSAPVGFELRVLGNERLQFNVGATVQPTYLLNTNSYLLTTDYTNYTREPSLFRRWNLSGGVEAFLTYNAGNGIRWQVGPEFRYQLMSTYNSQYPIHENLKGYGIKLGISKALP